MQTKLTIPNAEASIHMQQADQELTLAWSAGEWNLHIVDTSGLPTDSPLELKSKLSALETASLLFLIGNGDENGGEQVDTCYNILEAFLASCPLNLRPIP